MEVCSKGKECLSCTDFRSSRNGRAHRANMRCACMGSVALLRTGQTFRVEHDCGSHRTDLSRQGIKLLGKRPGSSPIEHEPALADHVHELNAGEHGAGGAERLEVEHRPGYPLDGAEVLFDDVVEVLDLAHHDRHVAAG